MGGTFTPVEEGALLRTDVVDSRRSLSLERGTLLCKEIVEPSPARSFFRKSSSSFLSAGIMRGLVIAFADHRGLSVIVDRREPSGRRGGNVGPPINIV